MSNLTSLLIATGKYMDEEMILDQLYDAIKTYKIKKTKDAKEVVMYFFTLMALKEISKNKSVEELTAEFERNKAISERFKATN